VSDRNSDSAKWNLKLACLGLLIFVIEVIAVSMYVEGLNGSVVGDAVSDLQEQVIYTIALAPVLLFESVQFFRACRLAKNPLAILAMIVSGALPMTFVWKTLFG
jgi:hypothetical protein